MEFSVVLCVYGKDNCEWFDTAVHSVLNQTVKPSEIVLVVDGPVPTELDEVINKYQQFEGFKVIRLKENSGHGEARRIGLENCSYNLIAIMDADDICLPDRFERQIKTFSDNEEVDIVGGDISEFINETNNVVGRRCVPCEDKEIKRYLKKRCPFNQMSVMFKKDAYLKAGGYMDWFCNEDYYLWIRMFLNGVKFANTGTVLVNVRVGEEMYKRRGGWKYFKSEAKLQKFMLKNNVINFFTYTLNILKRFILQVLMPARLRSWAFKHFAREKG